MTYTTANLISMIPAGTTLPRPYSINSWTSTSRTSPGQFEQGPDDVRGLQRRAGRLKALRNETETRGLNPNVWFGNVERIASERIGRETCSTSATFTSTTSPTL
jgi:hypothetical protein